MRLTIFMMAILVGCGGQPQLKNTQPPKATQASQISSPHQIATMDGVFTHLIRSYMKLPKSERIGFEWMISSHVARQVGSAMLIPPPLIDYPTQQGLEAAKITLSNINTKVRGGTFEHRNKIIKWGCLRFLAMIRKTKQ